jgi:DNA-binding PadR family transcriptional regulator
MAMSKSEQLGGFEHVVLLALVRMGDSAYGVTIRQELEERLGRHISIGSVYATLDRLEEKGFAKSRLGDATPERGGRPKRFFSITGDGVAALSDTRRVLVRLWNGLKVREAW